MLTHLGEKAPFLGNATIQKGTNIDERNYHKCKNPQLVLWVLFFPSHATLGGTCELCGQKHLLMGYVIQNMMTFETIFYVYAPFVLISPFDRMGTCYGGKMMRK